MTSTSGPTDLPVLLYTRVADPTELDRSVRALSALAARRLAVTDIVAETEPRATSKAAIDALRAAKAARTSHVTQPGRNGEHAPPACAAPADAGVRMALAGGGQAGLNPAIEALIRTLTEALEQAERRQHSERVRSSLARRRGARA